jgi:dGTPase
MLRCVFEAYLADPDRLGDGAMRRVEKEGLPRTVCDYIAGMTDRYVMEEYGRIEGGGGSPEPPSRV